MFYYNSSMESRKEYTLEVQRLGLVEYEKADTYQREIQAKRQQEKIPDTLLLLEHPNVITLGKRGAFTDILVKSDVLKEKKVQVLVTDRGGQNTIHVPGQLVGYLLVHLYKKQRALRQFVHDLEQSLIDTLKHFDIHAYHHDEHVGVWTDAGKIAAIGICVNQGVTRHGFALNVNNNLDIFNLIVPCGITNAKVTSMERELGSKVPMQEVEDVFMKTFVRQKGYSACHEASDLYAKK